MMKTPTKFIALLSGAALLASSAFAQGVVTNPVGYVTTTVAANSDGVLSAALHRAALFSGSVASIDDLDSISVTGTPGFSADEYAGGVNFVLFTSGSREGLWAVVTANGVDTIDLTFVTQDFGSAVDDRVEAGDTFDVIPFWTPGTLLPEGGTSAGTQLLVYSREQAGINLSPVSIYTLFDAYGWYNGPDDVNNAAIYPDESVVVRNKSAEPLSLVQSGAVPMAAFRTVLAAVSVGVQQDIRMTTGLASSVAMRDLLDPGVAAVGDQILLYDQTQTGENKSPVTIATYFDVYGWYSGPNDLNGRLLEPGEGFVYRKSAVNTSDIVVSHSPSYQN
jgi:uncharacterized protein (TIGR02597 family)